MKHRILVTIYLSYMMLVVCLMGAAMFAGPQQPELAIAFILSLIPEFLYWLIKGEQLVDVMLNRKDDA